MQVFKLVFHIVNKNKMSTLVYIGVFIFIAVFISKINTVDTSGEYTDESINVSVIDRDDTELSKALTQYVGRGNHLVDLPDDKERLRDELFYRTVEYILFIPEGFEEALLNGENPTLDNVKVPNSFTGAMLDGYINNYVGVLNTYMVGGYTKEEGVKKANELLKVNTEVNLLVEGGFTGSKPSFTYYFDYMSYVMVAIGILVIGFVLMPFFQQDVRRRNLCSSMKLTHLNGWVATGCIVAGLAIFLMLNVVGILLFHKEDMFWDIYPYYLANGLCISLVGFGLGFITGMVAKNSSMISGMSNTFSLGFAFLGGVFVPQEVMSKNVLDFSRFVPTYWYIRVNNLVINKIGQGVDYYQKIWGGMGVQIGFALAIFAVGLVVAGKRMEKS